MKRCAFGAAACSMTMADGVIWAESERKKPNFIIIFADDMGYGDASCYGNPTIKTPNIDRMATEGMKLSQFYSASSVCSPSRAALLTGRLPIRCGVKRVLFPDDTTGLPAGEITIADLLKKSGYATACIGKWHLGHKKGYLPTSHGFDSYFGLPYSNDMWIDPEAKLAKDIILNEEVTVEDIRADKYKKHNPKYMPLMRNDEVIEFPVDQATLTRRYTENAIKFIRENKDKPFFLYLAQTFPHVPLYASDSFKDKSLRGLYGDVIEELDWSTGQILSTLKQADIDKNTLVIFTSDNGPWLTQKLDGGSAGPLSGGKFTTWEGGQREPAIAWWHGTIPAGTINTGLVSTLDILPTLLDFAGADVPRDLNLDGYSIRKVLENNDKSPREVMYFYDSRSEKLRAIRMGPWKLHYETTTYTGYKYTKPDHPALYNVEQDPGERYNVADKYPEILTKIRKIADEHEKTFQK